MATTGAQYTLNGDCTLRLKNGDHTAVYVPAGTMVGADTPYDFEGPPNAVMFPLNDAAREAVEDAKAGDVEGSATDYATTGAQSLKNTPKPAEGGAVPNDPATDTKGPNDTKLADDPKAKQPGDVKK